MEDEEIRKTRNKVNLVSSVDPSQRVTFLASPQVTENRTVNYHSLEPLHAPGQIQVYKNTASRSFTISDIKLISRTTEEADANLKKLWRLRSWCLPRFGNSTTLDADNREARNLSRQERDTGELSDEEIDLRYGAAIGTELLGAPPAVLYLSAYSLGDVGSDPSTNDTRPGTNVWQRPQHINRVPVVINSLTIPYPNDIDYINDSNGTPMPIILSLELGLTETHSPNAYETFSLNDFRSGILVGF